jgi:hypothetical protein
MERLQVIFFWSSEKSPIGLLRGPRHLRCDERPEIPAPLNPFGIPRFSPAVTDLFLLLPRPLPEVTHRPQSITNVTFTDSDPHPKMAPWFGSSGGGLPRRPELNKLRALLTFELSALSRQLQILHPTKTIKSRAFRGAKAQALKGDR